MIEGLYQEESEGFVYNKTPFDNMINTLSTYKDDFYKDLPDPIDSTSYRDIYYSMPKVNVSFSKKDDEDKHYVEEVTSFRVFECKNIDYFGRYTSNNIYDSKQAHSEENDVPSVLIGFYIVFEKAKTGYSDYDITSITLNDKALEKKDNIFYLKIDESYGNELVFNFHLEKVEKQEAAIKNADNRKWLELYKTEYLDPKDVESYTGPNTDYDAMPHPYNSYNSLYGWLTPLVDKYGDTTDCYVPVGEYLMVYYNPSFQKEYEIYANEERMTPHPYFKGLYYYQVENINDIILSVKEVTNEEAKTATISSNSIDGMVVDSVDQLSLYSNLNGQINVGKYVLLVPLYYMYAINGKPVENKVTIYGTTYYYFKVEESIEYHIEKINYPFVPGDNWAFVDSTALNEVEFSVNYTTELQLTTLAYCNKLESSYLATGSLVVICDSAKEHGGILYNGVPMEEKVDENGNTYYITKIASTDTLITLTFAN